MGPEGQSGTVRLVSTGYERPFQLWLSANIAKLSSLRESCTSMVYWKQPLPLDLHWE